MECRFRLQFRQPRIRRPADPLANTLRSTPLARNRSGLGPPRPALAHGRSRCGQGVRPRPILRRPRTGHVLRIPLRQVPRLGRHIPTQQDDRRILAGNIQRFGALLRQQHRRHTPASAVSSRSESTGTESIPGTNAKSSASSRPETTPPASLRADMHCRSTTSPAHTTSRAWSTISSSIPTPVSTCHGAGRSNALASPPDGSRPCSETVSPNRRPYIRAGSS